MDFEVLDSVHGDTLAVGDIVSMDGEFHQLLRVDDADPNGIVEGRSYNLTTGDDDDSVLFGADELVDIYRSY